MPTRLLELVRHYPYDKGVPTSTDDDLLPRPRFSTRQYDALFIRIDTELSGSAKAQQKQHPVRLIAEAFRAEPAPNGGERYGAAWDKFKKAALEATEDVPLLDGFPTLSRIFADETIRFLSLVPADSSGKEPTSPSLAMFPPKFREGQTTRRRSFSLSDKDKKTNGFASSSYNSSNGHSRVNDGTSPVSPSTPLSVGITSNDWAQFSTSGFLESTTIQPLTATLFDEEDVEKTVPAIQQSKKRYKATSPARGRRSFSDNSPPAGLSGSASAGDAMKLVSKSTMVDLVQLDEAFVDFWSDALLDPVSSTWPTFVICRLKNSLAGLEVGGKRIDWIVIEQTYSRPPPQVPHLDIVTPESSRRPRTSSPKPSFKSDLSASRLSSTFTATRKRFSFLATRSSFSDESEKTVKGRGKLGMTPKIGEMGEILVEEEEKGDAKASEAVFKKRPTTGKSNGHGISSLAAGVFGAVAVIKEGASKSKPTSTETQSGENGKATLLAESRETQARVEKTSVVLDQTMKTSVVPDEIIVNAPEHLLSRTDDAPVVGAPEGSVSRTDDAPSGPMTPIKKATTGALLSAEALEDKASPTEDEGSVLPAVAPELNISVKITPPEGAKFPAGGLSQRENVLPSTASVHSVETVKPHELQISKNVLTGPDGALGVVPPLDETAHSSPPGRMLI
jgi:hypothetical protein